MSEDRNFLWDPLQKAIHRIAEQRGEKFAAILFPIININWEKERVSYYLYHHPECQPEDYVYFVANCYEKLFPRLYKLQIEKAREEWLPTFAWLQRIAFNELVRFGLLATTETQAIAEECAEDAGIEVSRQRFPYDTAFESWAVLIVRNKCKEYIRKQFNQGKKPTHNTVPLEEHMVEAHDHPIKHSPIEDQVANRDLWQHLYDSLSEEEKELFKLRYEEEKSIKEIAQKWGCSQAKIYKLLKQIIKKLQNLATNDNKYE